MVPRNSLLTQENRDFWTFLAGLFTKTEQDIQNFSVTCVETSVHVETVIAPTHRH
jgi:hypothetical protein